MLARCRSGRPAIFGGTAPYIGKALHSADADGVFFTYVTVCIAISLAVYVWVFSNKGPTHLDRQEGHAFEPVEPPAPVQVPV